MREFLDELKKSNPGDFASVMAGLARLRQRAYHRPPLSKAMGDALFELRHVGKLNTRIIYFFLKGRRIVAVHGVRNKGQALSAQDRRVAINRMNEWQSRDAR